MRRYIDTFARYWYLAVLPVLVLPLAGYNMTRTTPHKFTVVTSTWADQAAISPLIYTDQWSTPAQNLANYVNQVLHSSSFDVQVLRGSPAYQRLVGKNPYAQLVVTNDLATNAQASAAGSNLMQLSYSTSNPGLGVDVVRAILLAASDQARADNLKLTGRSVSSLQYQLRSTRTRLNSDSQSLTSYLSRHGIAPGDLVTASQADPTLGTIYQQVQNDQTALQSAQEQLSTALDQKRNISTHQTLSPFQVVDKPNVVTASTKKTKIMTLAIALLLGLILGGGFVVVKTMRDRSVRWSDEVPDLLGLPLLVTIPERTALVASTVQTAISGTERSSRAREAR